MVLCDETHEGLDREERCDSRNHSLARCKSGSEGSGLASGVPPQNRERGTDIRGKVSVLACLKGTMSQPHDSGLEGPGTTWL